MTLTTKEQEFLESLPAFAKFDDVANLDNDRALPSDWALASSLASEPSVARRRSPIRRSVSSETTHSIPAMAPASSRRGL